jgi:1-acyl-sn-glycerol-3-phosphate acyltransferase
MILRTAALWAIGLPATIVLFCAVLISLLFDRSGNSVHSIGALWSRIVLFLAGVEVEVRGVEKIPEGPFILASNHRGAFDIPVLHGYLPVQFRWLAKRSLFRIPIIGWSMSLAGYIPIERKHVGRAYRSIEEAAERIKAGISVLMFPEGTRSGTEKLLPFKRGLFMLASRSEAPIVPVAHRGTEKIVGFGNVFFRPSSVKVAVGDPIATKGVAEEELKEKTRGAIEALLEGPH